MKKIKKIPSILFAVIILITVLLSGCGVNPFFSYEVNKKIADFSVHYLDVGQGDSILISFPDGKNMLIDCGEESERNYSLIESYIKEYALNGIDYFLLTHPDSDHFGNAEKILNNISVGKLYLPFIFDTGVYPHLQNVCYIAEEKKIKKEYSQIFGGFSGEDYFLTFLSPLNKENPESSYNKINGKIDYDSDEINNISPIVYLEYKGVKFVFTGDAGFSQESLVKTYDDLGIYLDKNQNKLSIKDIDFLKVSHHGSKDSTSEDFLQMLMPKNAIISVGGNNTYGHPTTQTLKRIIDINPLCNILRTDVYGTISVFVNDSGQVSIVKESDRN